MFYPFCFPASQQVLGKRWYAWRRTDKPVKTQELCQYMWAKHMPQNLSNPWFGERDPEWNVGVLRVCFYWKIINNWVLGEMTVGPEKMCHFFDYLADPGISFRCYSSAGDTLNFFPWKSSWRETTYLHWSTLKIVIVISHGLVQALELVLLKMPAQRASIMGDMIEYRKKTECERINSFILSHPGYSHNFKQTYWLPVLSPSKDWTQS